jgi:ABC-type glycerol-3-phosphate transport system substrate-binding protein
MKNLSKFQLILTGIFAVFILVGVFIFSFSRSDNQVKSSVIVWGTISSSAFGNLLTATPLGRDNTLSISYIEKNASNFSTDFIEALAAGRGPDLVLAPHEVILQNRNLFFGIPFESFSERAYKDSYIEEGELFIFSDGIIALPIAVDPLVMYWNRDLFTNAGVSSPPRLWAEFYNLSQILTKKDGALNITQSIAPLGEYRNIKNAKELISALIMQAGNPITQRTQTGSKTVLKENIYNKEAPPTQTALTFYTEFSNPAKPFYSWNRSLPNSQDFFTAGDSAIYFGFASERETLRLKNPNLNFDTALLPQAQSGERSTTFGRLYALAIPARSKNIAAAFKVAFTLSDQGSGHLASHLGIAPAKRSLLASRPANNPHASVSYESALWSSGWIDPNWQESSTVFQSMVESITGGRARIDQAISTAHQELEALFR